MAVWHNHAKFVLSSLKCVLELLHQGVLLSYLFVVLHWFLRQVPLSIVLSVLSVHSLILYLSTWE